MYANFKTRIPPGEDFIWTDESGRTVATFLRRADGSITVFAEDPTRVRAIGANDERYERARRRHETHPVGT